MPPRPLTKGERRKLALFLAAVFALANAWAFGVVQRQFRDGGERLGRARAQLASARAWLDDRALWDRRREWIARQRPKPGESGDRAQDGASLLQSLQKQAADSGLTLLGQSLKDPRSTPRYQEAAVQLRLSGPLESLCRWMAAVQRPEAFLAVTSFSLRGDDTDAGKVICDLTIGRRYPLAP